MCARVWLCVAMQSAGGLQRSLMAPRNVQYGTFSAEDACNYAVNIYDDGAVLSIVVDAGSHGTQ